ncbi:NAD kinase [Bacteroidota bacterium]
MKIAVFGKEFKSEFKENFEEFYHFLKSRNVETIFYKKFYHFLRDQFDLKLDIKGIFESYEDLKNEFDLMASIGGDGTFLEAVTFVRDSKIPLLGINSGRLGFLATISREEITSTLQSFFNQEYSLESRSLIKIDSSPESFNGYHCGLNEAAVQKSGSNMITIHVFVDNELLNSYWADGLLVATPTGSTAYSLSVGGPILSPESNNFIISPIAPHTLTIRPVVIPDSHEIRLKVESRDSKFIASLDQRHEYFDTDQELVINRSNYSINLVRFNNISYYQTLRNKLMWGNDRRN